MARTIKSRPKTARTQKPLPRVASAPKPRKKPLRFLATIGEMEQVVDQIRAEKAAAEARAAAFEAPKPDKIYPSTPTG